MHDGLTQSDLDAALAECAREPVHIPGTIQPFGWLLAIDAESSEIAYASDNAATLFERPLHDILGKRADKVLDEEIWHGLQNARSMSAIAHHRVQIGRHPIGEQQCDMHLFRSGRYLVLEIETLSDDSDEAARILADQTFLVEKIEVCTTEAELLDLTTQLMRHVTGFDRVMIYRFDPDWNGEVVADAKRPSMESFKGLHFPHSDIPAQARAIMEKVPLRMIPDVGQRPVAIAASSPDLPPLDITLGHLRGVSPIHLRYLRNMGSAGTMTLSIMQDHMLWGIISFHHQTPRTTSTRTRQLAETFLPVFALKLRLLRQEADLALSVRVDMLQNEVFAQIEDETDLGTMLDAFGPIICQAIGVDGVVVITGSQYVSYGLAPGQATLDALMSRALGARGRTLVIESLEGELPELASDLGGCAGALMAVHADRRALCLLRSPIERHITWAGNPDQKVEDVNDDKRLEPRGSFATYVQSVDGHCAPWKREEIHQAKRLWPLLSAAERKSFMADLSRQQVLMIDELNHRVRNILALVKSVSRQARTGEASLDSYSKAIESRIHALAAAHDIGAGLDKTSVSIRQIIELEAEPYLIAGKERLKLVTPNRSIRADQAPLFALTIHELMTNAAKYGALSVPDGCVKIDITDIETGVEIRWTETGGPRVQAQHRKGFGTTLVQNAVPYELGGTSELFFEESGLRARITVPRAILENSRVRQDAGPLATFEPHVVQELSETARTSTALVVEDDFMIASDLVEELKTIGFQNIEVLGSAEDALDYVRAEPPFIALLDVNLGRGQTSEPVATHLLEHGIPFIFVTGYGEQHRFMPHLANAPRLTKPVSSLELRDTVMDVLG